MSRTPDNLTELRIKLSQPLVISLFEMAADGLVPANEKRVQMFIAQLVESAIADFRLQQLLKKNEKRKEYYLKPQMASTDFNHRTKISPELTQKILHVYGSGSTITEIAARYGISRTSVANILTKFADNKHVLTPLHGNRKRGNFPEIKLSI